MSSNRAFIIVFVGLGALISGAGAWSALGQHERYHSFASHLVFLLGVPFFAMAAGIATGGIENASSGSSGQPREAPDGWWEVPAFRRWLALRDASAAAWVILAVFGFFAFVDFFAKTDAPGALGPLTFLIWLWFLARLAWSVFKRTVVARGLEEARLFIRPREPRLGRSFAVRMEQAAASSATRAPSAPSRPR